MFLFPDGQQVQQEVNFAEKLFKKLDQLKEKFEVKLMFLDLVSFGVFLNNA